MEEAELLDRIELFRQFLLTSPVEFEAPDLGGGTPVSTGPIPVQYRPRIRTIGSMTLSSKPRRWAFLLFRLMRELKPETCLEMGTCVGISAAYQAAALTCNGSGRLITLEGVAPVAQRARDTLAELSLDRRVEVRQGAFQETLSGAVDDLRPVEWAFIDGHHAEEPTLEYLEVVLAGAAPEAVLVFDDINWSDGMRRAWSRIRRDPRFALTVDLRSVGIAVVSESAARRQELTFPYQ